MGDAGTTTIARLKKTQGERLLTDFDADPVTALTAALRIVLAAPDAEWVELLAAAPLDDTRRQLLIDGDEASLDQLAAELNERRDLIR